jgi:hypothetical protein
MLYDCAIDMSVDLQSLYQKYFHKNYQKRKLILLLNKQFKSRKSNLLFTKLKCMRILLTLSIMSTFVFSCKNNNNHIPSNNKILYHTFNNATLTIEHTNKILFSSLEEKANNETTKIKGIYWLEKASIVKKETNIFIKEIEKYEALLKAAANIHNEEGNEVFDEAAKAQVHKIFITEKNSSALLLSWANLNKQLLQLDEVIKIEFEQTIKKIEVKNNIVDKDHEENFKKRFSEATTAEALVILSSIKNDVTTIENNILTYCYHQTTPIRFCGFNRGPRFFISQNIKKVQAGDKIIITAGIVTFETNSHPTITINNKKVAISAYGSVEHEIETKNEIGKKIVPVKIELLDENGKKTTQTKYVEYEVLPK